MTNAIVAEQGREIDGKIYSPGKTFEELRREDPIPGPDEVYGPRPAHGDSFSIPNRWYFAEDHAKLEEEKLWPNMWLWACREEHIPKKGSCYVFDFLDYSIIIVRVAEDEIKAYRNTCMHRGNQLRPSGSCGIVNKFFCPFHGASWNLDGSIHKWPFPYEFPNVSDETHRLGEVHIARFQGFIFINVSDDPIPFDEFIDPLPEKLNGIDWNNRYPTIHMRKKLRCNWKVVVQAFNETMHVPHVHSMARSFNLTAGSQPDELGKYLFRIINPNFTSGDTMNRELSEKEVLEIALRLASGDLASGEDKPAQELNVPEGTRARDFMAVMIANMVQEKTGRDMSDVPTTELVDSHPIHLFPNFLMLNSYFGPAVMLMSPGESPDESYFDVMWFEECTPDFEKPPAPERIDIPVDEDFADHGDGTVFFPTYIPDEDTAPMEGQQKGLKASPNGVSTFSNYLESGIIHDLKLHKEFLGL